MLYQLVVRSKHTKSRLKKSQLMLYQPVPRSKHTVSL